MDSNAWTATEESAFRQLMQIGGLERLPAIRLYRWSNGDLAKATQIARDSFRHSDARVAGMAKARAARGQDMPPTSANGPASDVAPA